VHCDTIVVMLNGPNVHLLAYLITYLPTYSVEQSPSWEANWFSASQEIPTHFTEPEGPLPVLTSARYLSLS